MFMSSDIKFIRRDQKTRRNDEACPSHSVFSGRAWYTWYQKTLHGILVIMQYFPTLKPV